MRLRLLLVDDEEVIRIGVKRHLTKLGHSTKVASSIKETSKAIEKDTFDAIILDVRLPDGISLDLIKKIKSNDEETVVLVISGAADVPTAVQAIKFGATNFITKPTDLEGLQLSIQNNLELIQLRKQGARNQRLAEKKPSPYFGVSKKIAETKKYADIAARNDSVVLLLGETGTGKGVLAKRIHENSDRNKGTFVELNCSSLKGDLLRSELYGHTKGAFTSAIKEREGLIEIASDGTLFLDEIGDMDLSVQSELLKTIEEKEFRRIGENKIRKSNFRLICATNRNLKEECKKGTFRSDLYYRICVFPIKLPALRETKEDIPGLLEHFLLNAGYAHLPLDPELLEILSNYKWQGNIRELKNITERALLLAQGEPLTEIHFQGVAKLSSPKEEQNNWDLKDLERKHIIKTLEFFGDDKAATSKALGIPLNSLYKKLEGMDDAVPVEAY